jgi:hypothetical protein
MQLNEIFKVCLLALASRYPHCFLDINEAILGPQSARTEGWTSLELIEYFQRTTPEVLRAPARLVLDEQASAIYLLDRSLDTHAIWVHRPGNRHPWLEEEVHTLSV